MQQACFVISSSFSFVVCALIFSVLAWELVAKLEARKLKILKLIFIVTPENNIVVTSSHVTLFLWDFIVLFC